MKRKLGAASALEVIWDDGRNSGVGAVFGANMRSIVNREMKNKEKRRLQEQRLMQICGNVGLRILPIATCKYH